MFLNIDKKFKMVSEQKLIIPVVRRECFDKCRWGTSIAQRRQYVLMLLLCFKDKCWQWIPSGEARGKGLSVCLSPVTCCSWCAPDWQCLSVRSDIIAIGRVCTSEMCETPRWASGGLWVERVRSPWWRKPSDWLCGADGQWQKVLCGTQTGWLTGHWLIVNPFLKEIFLQSHLCGCLCLIVRLTWNGYAAVSSHFAWETYLLI